MQTLLFAIINSASAHNKESTMKKIYLIMMAAIMSLMGSLAFADFKPAVIYDMGGKFDKSFNEGVYNGIKRFTDETGIAVMEFEVTNEAQRQQAMEKMIQRGATQLQIQTKCSQLLMLIGWIDQTYVNILLKKKKVLI